MVITVDAIQGSVKGISGLLLGLRHRMKLQRSQSPITPSTRRPTRLHALIIILCMTGCTNAVCVGSECSPAEGWDNFANNLGSDLAPLLALFGEQVTKQYMSESLSWVDSLLFSLAPLGIITAIVAAIRVGGGPRLRSLIGRAKESRGEVEADLMSSTSSDVCELWNGEGVVRVLGRPVLLQLIHEESEESESDGSSGLYTFQEAVHKGLYQEEGKSNTNVSTGHSDLDSDVEKLLNRQNPPNLSLNVSMKPLPEWILVLLIIVGILLQGGVLVYAAVSQYILKLKKNDNQPTGYSFPLFLVGTLVLAVGMFLCAQVVESSTREETWLPTSGRKTVIWLQQGGQTVGDQRFESFARRTSGNIRTSHKLEKPKLAIQVIIGTGTTLFGFVVQFVALRMMHSSVTVAQLGAVLVMTAIRSCAHIQRESGNDIKYPDQVEGHELDWLARDLGACDAWEVISGPVVTEGLVTGAEGNEQTPPDPTGPHPRLARWLLKYIKAPIAGCLITRERKSEGSIANAGQAQDQNIAMKVMKIRARLTEFSGDWNLGDRTQVQILQNAIGAAMNDVYSGMALEDKWKHEKEFKWDLPVKAKTADGSWQQSEVSLTISRDRDQNGNWKPWKVNEGELEAVFCLWIFSLTETNRERAMKGLSRLKNARCLGLASPEAIADYKVWIYRGTIPETSPLSSGSRYFGWLGKGGPEGASELQVPIQEEYLCVTTESSLERICAQGLYAVFMFKIAEIIKDVGGTTTRRTINSTTVGGNSEWMRFGLINTSIDLLAKGYHNSSLGEIEEAYFAIIPALRSADKILSCGEEGRKILESKGCFEEAFDIDKLFYLNTKAVGLGQLGMPRVRAEIESCLFRLNARLLWVFTNERSIKSPSVHKEDLVGLCRIRRSLRLAVDPESVFQAVCNAVKILYIYRWHSSDMVLGFAWFLLQENREVEARELAKSIWDDTISACGGLPRKQNFEAAQILRAIRQRKDIFMREDELRPYLEDPERKRRTAMATIRADVKAVGGSVPFDLLLIRGWRTPLQAAAGAGRMGIVKQLLGANADVNAKPARGLEQTTLRGGVESGTYLAKVLLKVSTNIDRQAGTSGRTALQPAAEAGHLDIVESLLKEKAEVNAAPARGGHGRTALQAAAEAGHLDIVGLLLKVKAEVNAKPTESRGRTALQAAAEAGHLGIVELLLKEKAEVNAAPAWDGGRTALQAAAETGHLDIVELLLKGKAEVNAAPARRGHGRTALQAAAEAGHLDIVELLLKEKAEVNAEPARGGHGRTALQAAAGAGHLDIVELLLKGKAEVNAEPARGGHGRTALQAAAEAGHLDIVELLLKEKAEVNTVPARGGHGRTALQAAAEAGHLDIVELLLKEKAEVNAEPARGGHGRTALQAAAGAGHLDIVELLLKEKAGVNAEPAIGGYGRTALQAAAGTGHLDIVELLLKEKAEVNAEPGIGGHGRTALQAAAGAGHLDIVELLLKEKAEVNAKPTESHGQTALQAAAEAGHLDIVELLLKEKAEVNTAPAWDGGRTALQAAAEMGHLDIVELLLKEDAKVNTEPARFNGRTALQAAAEAGHLDIVELLLKEKAEVNAEPARGGHGRTALQAAAGAGHLDIVELLLKGKAEVNAEPAIGGHGRTALQAAAGAGHLDIVGLLLKVKAEVNAEPAIGGHGRTALQAAAGAGHLDIVELLLKEKANVNAKPAGSRGRTALQAAAETGHLDIVELLLKENAKVNAEPARGGHGRTALQAAAEAGHLDIIELLLKGGAKVNAEPARLNGRTALQAAAEAGHLDIVELLLKEKAKVNAKPAEYGRTALQAAAEAGHLDIIEILLGAGADTMTKTKLGYTARDLAEQSGHNIVGLLDTSVHI